jgi:hypothetical protein
MNLELLRIDSWSTQFLVQCFITICELTSSNWGTVSGFLQLKETIHVMMDKYNKFIK